MRVKLWSIVVKHRSGKTLAGVVIDLGEGFGPAAFKGLVGAYGGEVESAEIREVGEVPVSEVKVVESAGLRLELEEEKEEVEE